MNTGNPYTKPPLVEAILDVQVDLPSGFEYDKLLKCQQRLKAEYPDKQAIQLHHGRIKFGKETATSAATRQTGYRFISADKKQLFQAKTDGFSFNRLEPYNGWTQFIAEAKRTWEAYQRIAVPILFKRIALRYINRINFPFPTIELQTYFKTAPQVAPELPQMLNSYFFEVGLPLTEAKSNATITQTTVEPPAPGHTSVVLDIDVFRSEGLLGEKEMWPLFETLRVWKNRVFEACITDPTRELIR